AGAGTVLVGDWNGDGVDTPATFDGGNWVLRDGLGQTAGTTAATFGGASHTPVVGDWDGDGDDDIGSWVNKVWSLSTSQGANPAEIVFSYGRTNDSPVVGDWNGDGVSDPGVIRGSDWIRRIRGEGGNHVDLTRVTSFANANQAVVGDWEGTGVTNMAHYDGITVDRTGPLTGFDLRTDPDISVGASIQRCVSSTEQRYYRGELRAVANGGSQRTVNAVPVESYLRAVVPLEMPALWSPAAVQSQAVSARSYALAENRASYARTCDTISCQVYGGRAVRRNGSLFANEHPAADDAIAATAGVVRMRDGLVARTEFSSSTGGWTAGGVFPAVEDQGDSIAANPNHDWSITLPVAQIEGRWSNRQLDRVEVTQRNGLGGDGGRVWEVTLTFGDEVFTQSGNEFRRAYGLKSDWFTVDWERNDRRLDCVCPDWPDHGLDELFQDP
ncbi:MAG: SpoIID/LytB domain-containing protein, partial [Acidimicrobiales bacterium]